jgi:hypothetical protein
MRTCLLTIAILVACAGSVQSQSLGEVAAKEKERRAKTGGSAKSFTDSDLRDAALKRAREGNASSSGAAPLPSSVEGPVAQDASDSSDSSASEASKKVRGAEYKARLDATNAYLKQAEEEFKVAEKQWIMVSDHSWTFAGFFDRARSRFEAAKKQVELLRRQRDDIEDAARRESIPPGYLR